MSIETEISRIQTDRNIIRTKLKELGLAQANDGLDTLASAVAGIENRGAVSAEVRKGNVYSIPKGYHNGGGTVSGISSGTLSTEPLDPAAVYSATRPADWLQMPTPANNEMYLLFHIPEGSTSLLAFTVTCTGSYTVAVIDRSSGGQFVQRSAVSVASGSVYEAELSASSFGSRTSDGFVQALVKVSGSNITGWEPSTHSKKTAPTNFASWNIAEISCRLPSGTHVTCGNQSQNKALKYLRYFSWYGANQATDMGYMFSFCSALVAVLALDTSKVTNFGFFFNSCYALEATPAFDTANATATDEMYGYCFSLTAVHPMDTRKVTNTYGMFDGCYALVTIPPINTSNVTDMHHMFYNCYSLRSVPELQTSKVTTMKSMFRNCYALEQVPDMDTSKVTDMSYMFSYCCSLRSAPSLNTGCAENMMQMFAYCYALMSVPQINTQNVTNLGNMFLSCASLGKVTLNPSVTGWAGVKFEVTNCSLNRAALVALMNSLPRVTSAPQLTLTGNPGAAELTDTEKAIASGKGWTLKI